MPLISMLAVLVAVSTVEANNWPSWRGPTFNGVAPRGSYPLKWSSTENVAWRLKLPGKGTSTPIIWNNQIRSEEHTSELQSQAYLVCRLLLEKKKNTLNDTSLSTI